MPAYLFTATSWNGTAIVGGSIASAYWQVANGPLATQQMGVVQATIPGRGDVDVRGQPKSSIERLRVNLSAPTQAALADLHTLFNEQDGLCYFRMTDGTPVVWRRAQRVIGIEPVNTVSFDVVFYVPDPTWEEDAVNTDSQLNQQASPIAINLTNAGTRKAYPKVVVTADASKGTASALADYVWSLQGFVVNRAPNAIKCAYLMDQSGAAARLATGTSAADATVRQTTGATTLTADPGAAGATIAVTQLSGFAAGGGLAVIEWVTGSTFGTMEEIYYTGKSAASGAGNLTGCVRGRGGTTGQAHAIGAAIAPSATMPNGDDVRVWLDDSQIDRWLVAWNSAASDIAINVDLPGARSLTLAVAMTSAVPANGGSVTFNEDISWLPSTDFFVVGDEVFHYAAKSSDGRTVTGVQRGLWGSTLAVHAVNASAWAHPRRFIVGCGYALAGSPPAPASRRPAFQLPGSSNQVRKYGDQADDASTIYFDRSAPDRPYQFVPGFDEDGNGAAAPLISRSSSGTILTFKDDVPGDASERCNHMTLFVPEGIKASDANAIKNDWTPAAEILNLELFTRDAGGVWKLQDQLQQSAAAAARALPAALAATAYDIKMKARNNVATGFYTVPGFTAGVSVANGADDPHCDSAVGQVFKLDAETYVRGWQIWLAKAAGAQNFKSAIFADNGGQPAWGTSSSGAVTGALLLGAAQSVGAGAGWEQKTWIQGPVQLQAGTYHLVVWRSSPFSYANNIATRTAPSGYTRGRLEHGVGSSSTDLNATMVSLGGAMDFRILSDYDQSGNAVLCGDQPLRNSDATPSTRIGGTVSWDKPICTLEPLQTVYGHRMTAFVAGATAGSLLHLAGTLLNTTTGDSITVDKWMHPGSALAMDFDARTVVYTEDGVAHPVESCVDASGAPDGMAETPGANALTWTEPGLVAPGQIDIVTTHRGRKA